MVLYLRRSEVSQRDPAFSEFTAQQERCEINNQNKRIELLFEEKVSVNFLYKPSFHGRH